MAELSAIKDLSATFMLLYSFFLEDGVESGNIFDGNLGFVTRASQALLNTDTSPATFWITHPNNTYRNNVGAGSTMGYGFWYSLASFPTGPSATTTVCPKFTPLGEFSNNRAHSNMFYGLRIHPEYYPSANPCSVVDPTVLSNPFAQVPAVFYGFVSYKNGMKGAIATQVGLVQFVNMTLADNGGGPLSHIVNGKDNGAGFEMTWIVDDRSRINTSLTSMAGLQNTIIISRTLQGQVGTAGQWPSGRRITGVINQSPPEGSDRHTALSSMINITFVNYTGGQYLALEACGKCKIYQGGATTHTAGIAFSNPTGVPVVLSGWSWGHQGIYNDTDGTLLNSNSLTSRLMPSTFSLGPGASWHSAVNNDLFDPSECVYVQNKPTANNGAFCSPSVIFRRVMLNRHQPPALEYRNIWLTNVTNNRSSYVFFQHYNEDGYQFTVPTLRQTWIHWDMDFRLDPSQWVYHKMDPLNSSAGYVYLTEQFVQRDYDFLVSGVSTAVTNLTQLPAPSSVNTSHAGVALYNKTFTPDTWSYGNNTYNSTQLTVLVQGNLSCGTEIPVVEDNCPPGGCNNNPTLQVDIRNGTLYWSQNSTWVNRPGGAPVTGDNVTIPYGWNLVIDVDTPSLSAFVIEGNVTVSQSTNVTITATYMIVYTTGYFWIGQRNAPHPPNVIASIVLNGTRQTPDWAVNNNLDLGSKVLAAYNGGKIDLYGAQTGRRWTRLVATASANTSQLVVDGIQLGWSVGHKVLVTSSAWNLWQAEFRTIMAVAEYLSTSNMTNPPAFNTTMLTLDSSLTYSHWAKVKAYPGASSAVDMRVEVALVSSNIHITAADGPVTYIRGTGELFGARIIVAGNSSARISNIAMSYGGQAGLQRPAIQFQNLTKVDPTAQPMDALPNGGGATLTNVTGAPSNTANMLGTDTLISNPSIVADSSFIYNMDSGAGVTGVSATSSVTLTGNVFYESYDVHTVDIETDGNIISNNLALGTIKEMANVSAQNLQVSATFNIASSNNVVSGNTAAGSERAGFILAGPPCGAPPSFFNNTAHSSIVGFWLKSSSESQAAGCTVLYNCTAFMSWDFGVITTQGIVTSVQLTNVNVLDSKHAGMLILKVGQMHDPAQVNITGGIFAGATGPEVCGLCNNRVTGLEMVSPGGGLSGVSTNVVYVGDAGCAEKLTPNSYNLVSPFTPAVGLLSSTFALEFTPGPDRYPWDGLKGYPTILGISRQYNLTFADYQGPNCSAGTYALGNHVNATDAFHPHQFWGTNMVNVAQNGMVLFNGPDPTWRDEAHCGLATFTQPDGSLLNLNCGGPKHAIFRDMDGSMLSSTPGQASALAGQFGAMRTYPFDQGTPLPDGPCVYNSMISGYNCWSNMSTFTTPPMDLTLKPTPLPKTGIFGDPQLFVLESMDSDTETRNFGPVRFNVSGAVDLVITPFDHGWCFAYSCQMRISNFWTYIPTGQLTNITFTGSPPKTTQLWMPYADSGAEAIFAISYLGMPNRKFIWTATNGRYPGPYSAPPKIGDGSGHGAYYWDQSNTILWVKMVGGYRSLQVRTDNAVMVSNTLAMDINTFYSNQATFISGLAFLLGIDTSRIFIANIVPGSVVVNYSVSDSNTTGTDVINAIVPDLSQNVDGVTKTILALMTPAERAALQASYFADNAAQAASQSSSTISSPPPPPSPPASTTSLLSLLTALMAAVLDGSLAKAIGAQVLGFSVDVSGASGLNAADLAAITQLASSINSNATFNPPLNGSSNSGGSGSGAGSTGVGVTPSPSSGTGGTGLNVPLVVGLVVGLVGFVVLAVAFSAFIYIRHRANSSDNLAGGIGKAGKSATAVAPSISSRAIPFDASAYEDDGSGSLAGSGSGSGSAKRTSGKVVPLSSPTFSEGVPSSTAAAAAAGGAAALSLLSSSPSGSNHSKSGGNNPSGSYPSPPRTPAGISLHENTVANATAPTPFIFSPPAGQQKRLSSPSGLSRSAAGNPPRSSAPPHSDYSDRSQAEAGQVMYSGAGGEKGMATFYLPGGAASTRLPVDAAPSPLSTSPRASRRNSHGSAGMALLEPERNGNLIVSTTLNTSAPIHLVEASELESPMATAASSRARAWAQLHSDSMAEREQKEGDGSTAAAAAGSPLQPAVTVRQLPPLDPGTRMTSVKLPPLTFRNKDN
ncbi:hypothetical protein CEUSTIGMA_g8557.t1 [Chlamydomonas eustigma]|uniref:G8 domain-containing protein n=1 Tax=Chlamydomonas eustigma TaxID=1157962 RepID=A0A250XDG2_9CHLO|nr:hypothetical protein CEUSTIGMA_g8557.t1 [Chlamydomonas eustigma]|eukprot:GAX81123.1 hypothetical protein CEUSTIGMA_g8557.t1 [Chlamydomonas eustigma]